MKLALIKKKNKEEKKLYEEFYKDVDVALTLLYKGYDAALDLIFKKRYERLKASGSLNELSSLFTLGTNGDIESKLRDVVLGEESYETLEKQINIALLKSFYNHAVDKGSGASYKAYSDLIDIFYKTVSPKDYKEEGSFNEPEIFEVKRPLWEEYLNMLKEYKELINSGVVKNLPEEDEKMVFSLYLFEIDVFRRILKVGVYEEFKKEVDTGNGSKTTGHRELLKRIINEYKTTYLGCKKNSKGKEDIKCKNEFLNKIKNETLPNFLSDYVGAVLSRATNKKSKVNSSSNGISSGVNQK